MSIRASLLVAFLCCPLVGCDSGDKGAAPGAGAQAAVPKPAADAIETDVACGTCQFDMTGSGCELAVKVDGKSYFVSGIDMDALGDMHAADGLCSCVRRARISGKVEGEKYVATGIELLPLAAK